MKFELLKQSLKQQIKPAYYIGGADAYLLSKSLSLIEDACNLSLPDFNKVVFADEGFNAKNVVEACEALPLADQKRLIIVKDYLSKKSKENFQEEKKVFVKYLKNPMPSTCLVFYSSQGNNAFYTSFVNEVEYVDCNKLDVVVIKKWVLNKLPEGIKIDVQALQTLIEFCNFSLTKLNVEIDKLVSYIGSSQQITLADINEIITKDVEYVVYKLTDALSRKNGTTAYQIVDKLLLDGNSTTSIISIINNYFRRLFYCSVNVNMTNAELAGYLNVKEYAITMAKRQLSNFSQVKLKKIYDLCEQSEYNIKSGNMEGKNAIGYLIAQILKI